MGPKRPYLGIFGLELQKGIQEAKFDATMIILKSRKKNALFGLFWARMYYY